MSKKNTIPETLIELEPLCAAYALAASDLSKATTDLERDLAEVQATYADPLKALCAEVAQTEAAVRAWVGEHPDLFAAPRTHTINGVEVGMQAGVGSVKFDDEGTLIARIKKVFADDEEKIALLVTTSETVSKTALRALPASEFSRLGCEIEGAGDAVVVRRAGADIEKILKATVAQLVKGMLAQGDGSTKKGRAAR